MMNLLTDDVRRDPFPLYRQIRSASSVVHAPEGDLWMAFDRFDVARDPNPHLAFGHGIHFCLGAALSRLEAKVALGDLLERLHALELASDDPWEPRRALNVHGPASLPIRFTPASRSVPAR